MAFTSSEEADNITLQGADKTFCNWKNIELYTKTINLTTERLTLQFVG